MTFQVEDVTKPLASAGRIMSNGNRIRKTCQDIVPKVACPVMGQ